MNHPTPDASLVGVRASWTCALCRDQTRTYQLVRIAAPQALDLPAGWLLVNEQTVCGLHPSRVEEFREVSKEAARITALLRSVTPSENPLPESA